MMELETVGVINIEELQELEISHYKVEGNKVSLGGVIV
jgi:hypothetical protein